MAIDLHYLLPSPPCRAVMIVAKQLGIDLNLINVDLMSGEQKSAEYEKVNPRKKIPAINDNGFLLGESRAIMTYLINQYSPGHALYPTDAKKRAQIDRVMYQTFENFGRAGAIVGPVVFGGKWPIPEEAKEAYFELLKIVEQIKGDNKYLAGNEMTLADVSYICDLTVITGVMGIDISGVAPGIAEWMELMKTSLPEYEELVEKPVQGFKAMVEEKLGHKLE